MKNIIKEIRENIKALKGYFIWEVEEGTQKNTIDILTVDNINNTNLITTILIDGEKGKMSKKYFSNNGIDHDSIENTLNKYNIDLY